MGGTLLKLLLAAGAACVTFAIVVVAGATPTANTTASIAGSAQVGSVLTVTHGSYTPAEGGTLEPPTDAWQRCDDAAHSVNCTPVGTGTTYTVAAPDLGKYVSAVESVSDGIDVPYTFTTNSIGPIAPAPQAPQATAAPTISGSDLNVTKSLTRTAGTWSGNPTPTVTVAWQRCDDAQGNGCQDVGSGAASYALVAADVSKFMRVREAATNGVQPDGQAFSNVLGPVTQPLAPANPPVIDTTAPLVGQIITATGTGTWTGFPQPTGFSYAWQRCSDAAGSGCVAIGSNANAYAVVAADAGKWIRVQVTATNGTTQAQSAWVQTAQAVRQAPVNTAAPGLTPSNANLVFSTAGPAVTIAADTGAWAATPAVSSFAYEWQRCPSTDIASCAAIGGAAATSYTVQQADVGAFLRVKVTATNGVGAPGAAFSALTTAQIRQAPFQSGTDPMKPTILEPNDGIPNRGETLTGSAGAWFAFPAPTLTPQWQRCSLTGGNCVVIDPQPPVAPAVTTGPEPYRHTNGANSWRYVVTDADLGSTLKLVVFAANNAAPVATQQESVLTQPARGGPVNLAGAPNGLPALAGTAVRGQTLTATSGLWSGFAGTQPPLAITHQWQRCPLDGNLDNCVPVNADPPLVVNLAPAGAQACSSLAPCGGSSQYLLTDADLGSRLRVVVTVSNPVGSVQVATALTEVVVGAPIIKLLDGNPDPAALPLLTGTAAQGLTLVASTGSWSAYPRDDALTFTYEWLRCGGATLDSCTAVSGATTGYYLLGAADVGAQMRVRVTATNGVLPNGIASSAPTARVTGAGGGGGPGADLIIQLSTSTSGSDVTYRLRVGNIGSSDADGVVVTATMPDGLKLVSATSTRGTCTGRVTCDIGQVKAGEFITIDIAFGSSQSGSFAFTATVTSTTPDVNPSNNSVSSSSQLTSVGAAPKSGVSTVGGVRGGVTGGVTGAGSTQLTVPLGKVSLKARRSGTTWVAATRFTLFSGKAKLKLVVTENGSTKPLTLLKGSRLGSVKTKASATQIAAAAGTSAVFFVKVVLPARGFSRKAVYVIRITATATGGSSTLNIGFKGAALVKKKTTAKPVGKTWVATSALAVGTGKGTTVRAWVTRLTSSKKLALLKGSRLGGVAPKKGASVLATKTTKAGALRVRVVLPARGLVLAKTYVIRGEAKSRDGLWTDYEIRFRAQPRKAAKPGKAPVSVLAKPQTAP